MAYILTVTLNTSVDTTLTMPSPFMIGETNRVDSVLKLPGGKGLNVARVLHTLGVPVHVTGLAGGPAGEFIRVGLAEAGIASTFLPITGASRTCTALVEHDSHRVTEIYEPGPAITDTEAQAFLDLYETLLPGALVVVLSGSLPPGLRDDYYALLLNRAHAAGVSCILDTSDGPLRLGIPARPLLVKPNAAEAKQFFGREVQSVEDAVDVGQIMRKQGAQMVAITRGGEGAVLVTEMGTWLAGLHVSNPLSGVGSGDAFVAGFIAGLLRAVELKEAPSVREAATDAHSVVQALMLAMACGAANTLVLGAGVLNRDDVERFSPMVNVTALA
jgi:1-phosphofructokinase family hexose kinase